MEPKIWPKMPFNVCNSGGERVAGREVVPKVFLSVKQCMHTTGQCNPESFESNLSFFFFFHNSQVSC